ncbi:MAG: gfo/Idh/MocA family oxidoreductase, partial [Planctomycetes bacterium]|nr:gfo/Idh/MocA family oxidoreductase [Planctomycetota bacterium]
IYGCAYWNGGVIWVIERRAGWSEMEWQLRNWNYFAWLSGDHIVEQHVHNLDVANWVIGTHPVKAVSMGGRHRRVTGDQFDFFSTDFTYPKDVHVHSQCRQITGCTREVSERVVGEKGMSNCNGWISGQELPKVKSDPYVQEQADLIAAIRKGEPLNEAQQVAESTLTAIMARTSAYTGKEVTWDEMMTSDLVLGPPDYELTEENIRAHIPVPGAA